MNAKGKRLKKRSAANSRQLKKSKEYIFFIDEAIGVHDVPDALRNAGVEVETVHDVLYSGALDEEWIEYVGRNKRLAITKDKRIRHREIELQAIKKHKAKVFRYTSGNLSGKEMAEIAVKALIKMQDFADRHNGPFIVSLTKGGRLNPLNIWPK